jgi:hypothetical protein
MLVMARYRKLSNDYKLTARTVRTVWDGMVSSVRAFADERAIRFRGRKVGNEAFINAAVWHMAEMGRADQERILRAYLPRLESLLLPDEGEADDAPAPSDPPRQVGNFQSAPDPAPKRRSRRA